MVKCEACNNRVCKRDHENRALCLDRQNCHCTCQESEDDTGIKAIGSILLGSGLILGSIALTILTGGVAAVVIGSSVMASVGFSAVLQPIGKEIDGERMTGADYLIDVAVSAGTGALTGGIGAVGSAVTTKVASTVGKEALKRGATKLGCRAVIGTVNGVVSSSIKEGVKVGKDGGEFRGKKVLLGAAGGIVLGGVAHGLSNLAKVLPAAGAGALDAAERVVLQEHVRMSSTTTMQKTSVDAR